MNFNFKLIYSVFLPVSVLSCTSSSQKVENLPDNVISLSTQQLVSKVKTSKNCFIYMTTDWCGGGVLTFNNVVKPYLNEYPDSVFLVLIAKNSEKINAFCQKVNADDNLPILLISDFTLDAPFTHKSVAEDILSALDPNYKYQYEFPISVFFDADKSVLREGRLEAWAKTHPKTHPQR